MTRHDWVVLLCL